jgi:hypothetical protein
LRVGDAAGVPDDLDPHAPARSAQGGGDQVRGDGLGSLAGPRAAAHGRQAAQQLPLLLGDDLLGGAQHTRSGRGPLDRGGTARGIGGEAGDPGAHRPRRGAVAVLDRPQPEGHRLVRRGRQVGEDQQQRALRLRLHDQSGDDLPRQVEGPPPGRARHPQPGQQRDRAEQPGHAQRDGPPGAREQPPGGQRQEHHGDRQQVAAAQPRLPRAQVGARSVPRVDRQPPPATEIPRREADHHPPSFSASHGDTGRRPAAITRWACPTRRGGWWPGGRHGPRRGCGRRGGRRR